MLRAVSHNRIIYHLSHLSWSRAEVVVRVDGFSTSVLSDGLLRQSSRVGVGQLRSFNSLQGGGDVVVGRLQSGNSFPLPVSTVIVTPDINTRFHLSRGEDDL